MKHNGDNGNTPVYYNKLVIFSEEKEGGHSGKLHTSWPQDNKKAIRLRNSIDKTEWHVSTA